MSTVTIGQLVKMTIVWVDDDRRSEDIITTAELAPALRAGLLAEHRGGETPIETITQPRKVAYGRLRQGRNHEIVASVRDMTVQSQGYPIFDDPFERK